MGGKTLVTNPATHGRKILLMSGPRGFKNVRTNGRHAVGWTSSIEYSTPSLRVIGLGVKSTTRSTSCITWEGNKKPAKIVVNERIKGSDGEYIGEAKEHSKKKGRAGR